eukprot:gene7018-14283_t
MKEQKEHQHMNHGSKLEYIQPFETASSNTGDYEEDDDVQTKRSSNGNRDNKQTTHGISSSNNIHSSSSCCWCCCNGSNALPIDAFREEILNRVNRDRMTVIHGETGCGKSSRVPVILLEHAIEHNLPCRMMVSQPRRIGASSLMKRLRTTLGKQVGLRMGHGVRDEDSQTRIFFVTTGYLVRLIAHQPGAFDDHTHIIIDEVHERSLDGDVLCLLTRRLLQSHPTLRVILMSATIHTQLYKDYFTNQREDYGPLDCLSVGARRFPVNIRHAEDLMKGVDALPSLLINSVKRLGMLTSKCDGDGQATVSNDLVKEQYNVAVGLIKQVVKKGTGVLVFVSGMLDISELTERFENLYGFRVFAIHSDIPFEDQEAAFLPTAPDEVKVVIATNAAESSITLPDVDVVVCLGTHKSMRYFKQNHCVQLVNTWISKASATQRAGRTGRVRPGSVYRLYSRNLSEKFDDHEVAEVHRQPLQDIILRLRAMLEDTDSFEGVVPVLMDLLEPPDVDNVEKSFDYLFRADMLSRPDDSGELTSLGKFAGNLPIDLRHTRLLAYGIALGLKNEAVVMAAAFTLAKPPFIFGSPLIFTDPDQYNHVVMKAFLGNVRLDAGLYSQPIMLLCMLIRWRSLPNNDFARQKWSEGHGLSFKTMKQFESSARHLADRLDTALKGSIDDDEELNRSRVHNDIFHGLDYPSGENINLLRLLLVWTSVGNILRMKKVRMKAESERTFVTVKKPHLSLEHVSPLFPPSVPFALVNEDSRMYSAFMTSQQQQQRELGDLFLSLCALATSVKAPFVWLHLNLQLSKYKGKGNGKEEDSVTVVGVHMEHKELLMSKLERIFTSADSLDYCGNIQEGCPFEAFVCTSPSKNEIKLLNAIHTDLPLCLRMGVFGSDSPAVLMAYNCVPASGKLEKLFYGCNIDTCVDNSHDHATHRISEQIHSSLQKISFPTVDTNDLQFHDSRRESMNSSKDRKLDKSFQLTEENYIEEVSPLVEDIQLGMRLLNAYQQGYYDRHIRLWKVPATDEERKKVIHQKKAVKRPIQPINIPGIISAGRQEMNVSVEEAVDPKDGNKILLTLRVLTPNWEYLRGINDDTMSKSLQTFMPLQSVISTAVPAGTQSMYAVAQSLLLVEGEQSVSARCQWVSLLPPGSLWLTLAMRCLDMDTSDLTTGEVKKDQIPSEQQVTLSIRIAIMLKDCHITPNPVLRDMVVKLFSSWTVGRKCNDDEAGDGDCVKDFDDGDDNDNNRQRYVPMLFTPSDSFQPVDSGKDGRTAGRGGVSDSYKEREENDLIQNTTNVTADVTGNESGVSIVHYTPKHKFACRICAAGCRSEKRCRKHLQLVHSITCADKNDWMPLFDEIQSNVKKDKKGQKTKEIVVVNNNTSNSNTIQTTLNPAPSIAPIDYNGMMIPVVRSDIVKENKEGLDCLNIVPTPKLSNNNNNNNNNNKIESLLSDNLPVVALSSQSIIHRMKGSEFVLHNWDEYDEGDFNLKSCCRHLIRTHKMVDVHANDVMSHFVQVEKIRKETKQDKKKWNRMTSSSSNNINFNDNKDRTLQPVVTHHITSMINTSDSDMTTLTHTYIPSNNDVKNIDKRNDVHMSNNNNNNKIESLLSDNLPVATLSSQSIIHRMKGSEFVVHNWENDGDNDDNDHDDNSLIENKTNVTVQINERKGQQQQQQQIYQESGVSIVSYSPRHNFACRICAAGCRSEKRCRKHLQLVHSITCADKNDWKPLFDEIQSILKEVKGSNNNSKNNDKKKKKEKTIELVATVNNDIRVADDDDDDDDVVVLKDEDDDQQEYIENEDTEQPSQNQQQIHENDDKVEKLPVDQKFKCRICGSICQSLEGYHRHLRLIHIKTTDALVRTNAGMSRLDTQLERENVNVKMEEAVVNVLTNGGGNTTTLSRYNINDNSINNSNNNNYYNNAKTATPPTDFNSDGVLHHNIRNVTVVKENEIRGTGAVQQQYQQQSIKSCNSCTTTSSLKQMMSGCNSESEQQYNGIEVDYSYDDSMMMKD